MPLLALDCTTEHLEDTVFLGPLKGPSPHLVKALCSTTHFHFNFEMFKQSTITFNETQSVAQIKKAQT